MEGSNKASFWTSLPGILTGLAALVTAGATAYLALRTGTANPPPPVYVPPVTTTRPKPLPLPTRPTRAVAVSVRLRPGAHSESIGGTGGDAFALACADNQAVIGIEGSFGGLVHALRATCATMRTREGGGLGPVDPVTRTATRGSEFEQTYSQRCPANAAITGLTIQALRLPDGNTYVNYLVPTCSAFQSDAAGGVLARQVATLNPMGRYSAQASRIEFSCAAGAVVIGFVGRSGASIDALRVECGTLSRS